MVLQLAGAGSTLAVVGEPGSGKAELARLFHEACPRANGPLVAVHCRDLDDRIVSRILFGTSTTSLVGDGALRAAAGGTLLLNGVDTMALDLQRRLLRALEAEVSLVPLTHSGSGRISLGIVTASREDLRRAIARGKLLEELCVRLGRNLVSVPPLRHCREDIPSEVASAVVQVSQEVPAHVSLVESCLLRDWPSNLLELRTEVKMAAHRALASNRGSIRASDLDPRAGLPLESERLSEAQEGPLKVLFLVANPMAPSRLDIASEFRELDEALGPARDEGRVELRVVLVAEPEDIQQNILRFRPTVVHFSAHGEAPQSQDDAGGLIIEGADGAYEISPKALASFFAHFNSTVRCVVVNSCHSERQAHLLAQSVDCVVGMRGALSDQAASIFSGAFYEGIVHGESLQSAFGLACAAIELHGLDEGNVPCLAVHTGVDATTVRLSSSLVETPT